MYWRGDVARKRRLSHCNILLMVLLLALGGCAYRGLTPTSVEPPPPVSADTWREIREEIWTASALAQSEAEIYARAAMQEWMVRVREKTENEFVPWYSGYWAQQWIGFKAGWYEMNREDGDAPVEDYLVDYLQEEFYELVLEPAGMEGNPQTVTEQAAALFVRLLSEQLQCVPKTHAVSLRSLQKKLEQIPLITLAGSRPDSASLFLLFEHDNLVGVSAYDGLIAQANSVEKQENSSPDKERLQIVAEESVTRLVAQLPVRAGGSAVAMVVGEALGLFVSAGVAAWSAASHEEEKAEIESRLREVLHTGLDDMWQTLMENPELGVLSPVNHMRDQIETGLFPAYESEPPVPF